MSAITKILAQPPDYFSTQIASSTISGTDLTIQLDSVSGLPTEGVGQLFKKDSNGNLIAGSIEFIHWTNVAGSTITLTDTGDRGITGSDSGAQSYVADDYFEVWASSYYTSYGARTQLNDTNGNETLKFTATASAVNEFTMTNAATAGAPILSATGGDDNIGITLTPKGTGVITASSPIALKDATTSTGDGQIVFDRTNEKLLIGDGTNTQSIKMGAWTDWVPTWTNLTKGSATIAAKYAQIGKLVFFRIDLTFAADTSIAGNVSFTLPVTAVSYAGTASLQIIGQAEIYDTGGTPSYINGMVSWYSTTTAGITVHKTDGTYLTEVALSSTVPMTWTTNDELHCYGVYEAA